jgi:tRNA(fMet)-specific endonuclease VapC
VTFLLNTDYCIYLIKKRYPLLLERLKTHTPSEFAISSITIAELQYGIHKSTRPEQNRIALEQFLSPFVILSFEEADCTEYGAIRAELEKKGQVSGGMDLLIAAQARSRSLILLTNNTVELGRIVNLMMENWLT